MNNNSEALLQKIKNKEQIKGRGYIKSSFSLRLYNQPEELPFRPVKRSAEKEGATEGLNSTDRMAWIGVMNSTQARARKIVYADIIHAQSYSGSVMGILIPLLVPIYAVDFFTNL